MRHHGLVRDGEGRATEFRFGVHKLLEAVLATWFLNPMFDSEPTPPPWPYRPIGLDFERAFSRMHDAFHLMARAALHLDKQWEILRDPQYGDVDGMHIDEFAPWLSAHEDIVIYGDAAVHYLYDHANSLAMVLSHVFTDGSPHPSGKSFYRHRDSVANGASRDAEYERILAEQTGWFDRLAATLDDPQPGVRTQLVHGLHGEAGARSLRQHHVERARDLREIVHGYLAMQEQVFHWLRHRLSGLAVEGSQIALVLSADPPFMTYTPPAAGPTLLASTWLYPEAQSL